MMNPPDLPFGNRRIDLGNPYGVLRMQYSDCNMKPNNADEAEITKDTFLSDAQIHMVKIPDSVINCDRRSGALRSSIKKKDMVETYMEVIRAAKKKKKFKTFSSNMCHIKKPALQLEESEKQKLTKVKKFRDNTMEKTPLRNNDVIMENVER